MHHTVRPFLGVLPLAILAFACASEHHARPETSAPAPLTPAPGPAQSPNPGVAAAGGEDVRQAEAAQKPVTVSPLGVFGDWDSNGDGQIEMQEFQSRLRSSKSFGEFDANGDEQLSEREFTTALYEAWDVDGDDLVDVYEYRNGQGAWFVDGKFWTMFDDWDKDDNKELTLVELQPQGAQMLSSFDTNSDRSVDEAEFSTARYKAWDVNADGVVDIYEFNRIGDLPAASNSAAGSAKSGSAPGMAGQANAAKGSSADKASATASSDRSQQAPRVATYGAFYVYDLNRDSKVSLEEFRQTLASTSLFDDWDSVKRGDVNQADYRSRLFEFWDLDGDDQLGLYEFRHGAGVFFPRVDTYGNFVAWDANKDTRLTKEEFVDYAGKTRLSKDWNKDKSQDLQAKELDALLYQAWDTNGDGSLDVEEWRWR